MAEATKCVAELAVLFLFAATGTVVLGCSSSSPAQSSTVAPAPSADACKSRCASKSARCGASSSDAATACSSLCAQAPSEAELACTESSTCGDLVQSKGQIPTKCKSPGTEPGPGTVLAKFGEACACTDGSTFCRSTSGPCEASLTCFDGACRGAACDISKETPKECPSGQGCYLLGATTGWCGVLPK